MSVEQNVGIKLITIIRRWLDENIKYNITYHQTDTIEHIFGTDHVVTVRIRSEFQKEARVSIVSPIELCVFYNTFCVILPILPIHGGQQHANQIRRTLYIADPNFFETLKETLNTAINYLIDNGYKLPVKYEH